MARLESRARAGFFPTPPRIADAIAHYLTPVGYTGRQSSRVVRLLDPCAGTGAAAAVIGRRLRAVTYGVELNDERAREAGGVLDHVLATSAFTTRLANGAFSVLYLNPPYDYDDERRRLEHAFLTTLSRALCAQGVLVFVLPQSRLAVSARYLATHYAGHAVYRFPDPEFVAYRQIVVFALRKTAAVADAAAQARLEWCAEDELPPLPMSVGEPGAEEAVPAAFQVPALPAGEVLFASLFFDPIRAEEEARRRGVWTQPAFADHLWPPGDRPVRPLMPLRRGHLAMLVAAGMLNNVVLRDPGDPGGRRVLVKGRTRKELVPVETDRDDVEVEREVLRTAVVVLDLGTGEIETVDSGSDGPDEASDPVGSAGSVFDHQQRLPAKVFTRKRESVAP